MTQGRRTLVDARIQAVAALSIVLSVLPVFLLGGLAVFVREDLGFTELELGLSASIFWVTSAAVSVTGGRFCELVGPRRAMVTAAVGSGLALGGTAVLAASWTQLTAFIVLAGVANGISQPATNLALARHVPVGRQGLAFGMKQAAVPVATLLSGFAVPLLGLRVGWRSAFAVGAGLAPVFLMAVPRRWPSVVEPRNPSPPESWLSDDMPTRQLAVFSLASGLGVVAANSLGAFYVESAVSQGVQVGQAGLWFAFGSACGITARVTWGWVVDRHSANPLRLTMWLLILGAPGMMLLGFAASPVAMVVGTLLAFAAGWGWNGLFALGIVQQNTSAPGAATGITFVGLFIGGGLGPAAFGAVVTVASYQTAWVVVAGSALVGASLMWLATRRWPGR